MPTTPRGTLSAGKLRELARAGAEVTIKRLRAEIIAIAYSGHDERRFRAS